MNGVWYAAIGAAFILGLLFVLAYYRRGASQQRFLATERNRAPGASAATGGTDSTGRGAEPASPGLSASRTGMPRPR